MTGKLYGIGVGPGDPELLTLKALRLIKGSDVIAVPGKIPQETVAYKIVEGIYPEFWKKELLGIHMPMTKDAKVLKESRDEGVRRLCGKLRSRLWRQYTADWRRRRQSWRRMWLTGALY